MVNKKITELSANEPAMTSTLIILNIAKTEFNNCFIIHLFVLNVVNHRRLTCR
jgi:hypothetical protein